MKDLSYLQAFSTKVLRSVGRILEKGFTAEDVSEFLEQPVQTIENALPERKESSKRIQYGKAQGNPRPFEDRDKPCSGCKEKREEVK